MKIEAGKTYVATQHSKIYAKGDKFHVDWIYEPDKDGRVFVSVTFIDGERYNDTIEHFEPEFLKEVKSPPELIKGGVYVLNEGIYSDSGKLLPGGYAVILKEYDALAGRALIEYDGSKFWIDPSYLDFIEGDVPVESQDEPQPAEYPPGTKLTSNRLFTIAEPSKPAHYDTGIDTIAFMRANCPPEQVEGFLRGNALKYLQRYPSKGTPVEDLKKARHYLDILIEEVEGR